jgi:hypothetical protein
MKKTTALLLLFLYLAVATQSLLPWVADVVAHTFFWHQHLHLVHHGEVHSAHVTREWNAYDQDQSHHAHTQLFVFDKNALSAHLPPDLPNWRGVAEEYRPVAAWAWLFPSTHYSGNVLLPPPDAA